MVANDHQKNSMAPLDDNSVPYEGTSFCVGSWIFVVDRSGGFRSRTIDQSTPKIAEATSRQEIDDFIDQLEEVGHPASYFETRIQLEFGMVETKTLSELEEDLDRLLEDTKPETSMDKKILSSGCVGVLPSGSPRGIPRRVVMSRDSPRSKRDGERNTRI